MSERVAGLQAMVARALALSLWLVTPLAAQVIAIEDTTITNKSLGNSYRAEYRINGRRIEVGFQRETVPGDGFLTIREYFPEFTTVTLYRYLGQEASVIRFAIERELERKTGAAVVTEEQGSNVITYYSKLGGKYVVVPSELQHVGIYFEVIPLPERGFLGAFVKSTRPPA